MAYLILAHDDSRGLLALADALLGPDSADVVLIHADRRSALGAELQDAGIADPRIRIVSDPVAVRWGHHSQVEATFRLIEAALQTGCDFAHLISGQDWPCASRQQIVADIAAQPPGTCYAEAQAGVQDERMQQFRFDTRWLRLNPERDRLAYALAWEMRRASRTVARLARSLALERSRPLGPWHKGSTWWSMPVPALRVVADELAGLLKSGRLAGTVCADEHVIPTILANRLPGLLHPNRRFIRFPDGASSPRLLIRADEPAIRASGAWFIRKVDAAVDPFFREFRPAR